MATRHNRTAGTSAHKLLFGSALMAMTEVREAAVSDLRTDAPPNPLAPNQRRIVLGIAAMRKKTKAKPMQSILSRLSPATFEVVIFEEEVILHKPVEDWPHCDALISFFSTGFPLAKAEAYVALRQPYLVNDLAMQWVIRDRRQVYQRLRQAGVPTARHCVLNRPDTDADAIGPVSATTTAAAAASDASEEKTATAQTQTPGGGAASHVVEQIDSIEVDGVRIEKPFVEKPADAEDHNVYIYYPSSAGGGSKRLFRKVKNKSSQFYPNEHSVRKTGSYIYEEFLTTGGTDVKVYTVGRDYAHAEARKAPTLDGRVVRNAEGKEVRYPVILSPAEKQIASLVCNTFKQTICGFDLLRCTNGVSYVCDVNGLSFVKNSSRYYDDCAAVLSHQLTRAFLQKPPTHSAVTSGACARPNTPVLQLPSSPWSPIPSPAANSPGTSSVTSANDADASGAASRMDVDARAGVDFGADFAVNEASSQSSATKQKRKRGKANRKGSSGFEELRSLIVVTRHGERTPKQKLKMLVRNPELLQLFERFGTEEKVKQGRSELKLKKADELQQLLDITLEILASECPKSLDEDQRNKFMQIKDVLQAGGRFAGINRKCQLKPVRWVHGSGQESDSCEPDTCSGGQESGAHSRLSCAQLVLKWGGVLTHAGRQQAKAFGAFCRDHLYPGEKGGLLRLHSTFRHDLKITTSDEGRVQETAAAFSMGFLDLEGDVTRDLGPILISLVRHNDGPLLDDAGNETAAHARQESKAAVHAMLTKAQNLSSDPGVSSTGSDSTNPPSATKPALKRRRTLDPQLPPITTWSQADSLRDAYALLSSLASSSPSTAACSSGGQHQGGPLQALEQLHAFVGRIVQQLASAASSAVAAATPDAEKQGECERAAEEKQDKHTSTTGLGDDKGLQDGSEKELYMGESPALVHARWSKLHKELRKKGKYDISKLPDLYDNAKFDLQHDNFAKLGIGCGVGSDDDTDNVSEAEIRTFYTTLRAFSHFIVPQEYGLKQNRAFIGVSICRPLISKIWLDLQLAMMNAISTIPTSRWSSRLQSAPGDSAIDGIKSRDRMVRTRLYFASESILITLLNFLRMDSTISDDAVSSGASLLDDSARDLLGKINELDYLTSFVFKLFENVETEPTDPRRYRLEIHFSPGITGTSGKHADLLRHVDLPVCSEWRSRQSVAAGISEEYDDATAAGAPVVPFVCLQRNLRPAQFETAVRDAQRRFGLEPLSLPMPPHISTFVPSKHLSTPGRTPVSAAF